MKRNLLACAAILLLTGCANFAGIDWNKEIASTQWRGLDPDPSFGVGTNQSVGVGTKFTLWQGKLVGETRLNERGMAKMESQGCKGCHEDGGVKPSLNVALFYTTIAEPNLVVVKK